MLLLGAHFSIAGGLHNALATAERYGCTALQIFTKNANAWRERTLTDPEIEVFAVERKRVGIEAIASHTSYLINLASPDRAIRERSRKALASELLRCTRLGIPYVVHHPGAPKEDGARKGIERVASAINRIFDRNPGITARLLLESTAGQGSSLGHTFEQLALLLDRIENAGGVGVCLDTCHLFAAGYDLRTPRAYRRTLREFDRDVGLGRLFLLHLNDSRRELGSRVDRHEHIGEGRVGKEGFRALMTDRRLDRVPKILETPKIRNGKDADRLNLSRLRRMARL